VGEGNDSELGGNVMATKEELEVLIAGITKELGTPWKVEPDEWARAPHIGDGNEGRLYLSTEKERVHIHGSLNIGKNGAYVILYENNIRVTAPSISVALSRGHGAIATEIKRRLLPEYLRVLELAKAKRDGEENYERSRHANLIELAALVGKNYSELKEGTESLSFYHDKKGYGDIWASADSVNLKLNNLSIAKAKEILKMLEIA
jgi:hypothetical protein